MIKPTKRPQERRNFTAPGGRLAKTATAPDPHDGTNGTASTGTNDGPARSNDTGHYGSLDQNFTSRARVQQR